MESQTLRMPESTIEASEADGSSPTLSELFVAMEGPLLAYATKLMNDRSEAQDLVQEAFVRLHGHFDEVRLPKAWLYRTVRNQFLTSSGWLFQSAGAKLNGNSEILNMRSLKAGEVCKALLEKENGSKTADKEE